MNLDLSRSNLAINGGKPVRIKKWLDNFSTGEEEKQAALRALNSGYLSLFEGSHVPDKPFSFKGGPEVIDLEEEWSKFYQVPYSITVNSATSGLYAAIGALEIGFGDEVIVSPYTMTACAMAPMIYGAIPVFADVDPLTGCLDPKSVKEKISNKTKGIIVVHQFGFPANMDKLMSLAKKFDIKVIEDCAQAHGAKYKGKYVGTIGDIGIFSLNVNKTIQSGEGGVCVTKSSELAYRLQLIRNHGEAVVGPAKYENIVNIAGFNYRMTEICAAIAKEQLKKLPFLNEKRIELVQRLKKGLKPYNNFFKPLEGPNECNDCECSTSKKCQSTYYVFPIIFKSKELKIDRNKFISAINAEGIVFFQGYVKPLYYQPLYRERLLFKHGYPFTAPENKNCNQEYKDGLCPVAEDLHFNKIVISEHIRLPHTKKDIDDIILAVKKVVNS